jgi:hypothetical protein
MTRRENTNKLDQYFVLDITHTIYGTMIGIDLKGRFKFVFYLFFLLLQLVMSFNGDIYYHTSHFLKLSHV